MEISSIPGIFKVTDNRNLNFKGKAKEESHIKEIPLYGGYAPVLSNEEYLLSEYKKLNQEDMLQNSSYKKRALMMAQVRDSSGKRAFAGGDILDLLWNPNPDMDWYVKNGRKLAHINGNDNKALYSGCDIINILSCPNMDVETFIQDTESFLEKSGDSVFGGSFFQGADVAQIISGGLTDRVLFDLPEKVDVEKYSPQNCIKAAEFLEFHGLKSLDEPPPAQKIKLLNLLVCLPQDDLSSNEAIKPDFPLIPTNVDELKKEITDINKALEELPAQFRPQCSREELLDAAIECKDYDPDNIYCALKQKGFDDDSIDSVIRIVGQKDLIASPDEKALKYAAFRLKDGDDFELAKDFLNLIYPDSDNGRIFEKVEQYIKEIRNNDFVLPQTSYEELMKWAQNVSVKGRDIKLVRPSDMEDFHVFAASLEPWFNPNQDKELNLAKFETRQHPYNSAKASLSYISGKNPATAGSYGIIADVKPKNVHVAAGWDFWSDTKISPKDMYEIYYTENGKARNLDCGKPKALREFVSKRLKETGNFTDDEYCKIMTRLSKSFSTGAPDMKDIAEISPEYAKALGEFLSQDENAQNKQQYLMRGEHQNEALVYNPKIKALYADSIETLPDEYIEYASKNNLPVVLIKS